jgi:acyl-CoA synthetase (AMP-forming)/AMP-acid ligase II/acyl carrier protein
MNASANGIPFPAITDLLQVNATERGDNIAFAHLIDGQVSAELNYRQLDIRVKQAGAGLVEIGVRFGDRVVLLFPSSLDFIVAFLGCQWIGAIPVPAYPPQRDDATISRILVDCAASWVVTTPTISERIALKFPEFGAGKVRIIAFDASFGTGVRECGSVSNEIAMLQYTSGSTSEPKGVVLSHRNLLANVGSIAAHMEAKPGEIAVSWLPMYHDMGLIGMVLGSLFSGVSLYFMAPAEFVRDPALWLRAIGTYGATYSGGPNFAYQHCVDRIGPAALAEFKLAGWRVATNGAEPVRQNVLEAFCEKFAVCGFTRKAFLPCYGLAESSLMVTGVKVGEPPLARYVDRAGMEHGKVVLTSRAAKGSLAYVSCGSAVRDQDVAISDTVTGDRLPENVCGEILVAGPSVTDGYWPLTEGAAATRTQPFAILNQADGNQVRYLRTGDLGFLSDGQLFVTGRMKDLIIVRGLNYHPQDLEEVAWQSHTAIEPNGVIAFQADQSDTFDIVVIAEIRREVLRRADLAEIVAVVRSALAVHFQLAGIAVGLVGPRALPRTSSGKVKRSQAQATQRDCQFQLLCFDDGRAPNSTLHDEGLKAADAVVHEPLALPLSHIESWLHDLVARNLKIDRELVRCDMPVLEMGLDSLSQLQLTHEINAKFGFDVEVEHYFDGVSIRDIGQLIERAEAA